MRKIKWGILSTAKIGVNKVIPALQKSNFGEVKAIASRTIGTATKAAEKLGIPKAYGSYEALLADPEIDAIYNPLPNHLHVPWSIRAIEAGKHVLCEKPVALSSTEAQTLWETAQRHPEIKVMEAFMYRFHPQWKTTKKMVKEGRIGELRTIQSFFSYYNTDPDNYRNKPQSGGGGLMDIGCYNISLSRFIFGNEPIRVTGVIEYDPVFKVDRLASGILEFKQGFSAFTCGTQLEPYQNAKILGTKGQIEIVRPFNPPPDQPAVVWFTLNEKREKILIPAADQFTLEGDAFASAILNNTPVPTPLEDALANMKVIEAVFKSAEQDGWENPE